MINLFTELKQIWEFDDSKRKYFRLINVLPNLHQLLKEQLGTKYCYVISTNANSDIQKFFVSCEILKLNKQFQTLQGLIYTLDEKAFKRVDKVTGFSEWTIKGDTIQFWPIGYKNPIRASYFGDSVESIELYDYVYNTKLEKLNHIVIGNNSKIEDFADRTTVEIVNPSCEFKDFFIVFSTNALDQVNQVVDYFQEVEYDFYYPELFFANLEVLYKRINNYISQGFKVEIQTKHPEKFSKQLSNYIRRDLNTENVWDAGIISPKYKVAIFTDREIFGTIFINSSNKNISSRQAKKILERLEGEISVGDYIVHEDHGIGIYRGIIQETKSEKILKNFVWETIKEKIDYLKISYAEGDELLIPFSQLHKVTKYTGTTDEEPNVTRLNKGTWQKTISKVKKTIQVIARDLVEHYAKIELSKTFPITTEHSTEFDKFLDEFEYSDTTDQILVSEEIYQDLSKQVPMDRLIVGDVGFGKTEVAMRAAFKVAESGKQVAILCPTTVLAAQHYKVFKDRFRNFQFTIEYVSRFNDSHTNKEIIDKANYGKVDILIGTHRLLSSDLFFKNLGLIVIDEEQKFGVKQKEKIRKLQYSAHTLNMTATPIPRTLSMAMSEIKEISILSTPPKDRIAVHTEVDKFDWNKIVYQLQYEFKRSGQSYYLHNKVETILSIQKKLEELLPNLGFAYAHGQMNPKELDKTIKEFYDKKYDCLICTTIIENGIDMPNVNTIIINDGQNFGLGQLYQLRGRVGRSDKKAYCYIYYKGKELEDKEKVNIEENAKIGSPKYVQRLKAIMESRELGSGFKLASRDLEIRGAGSLLGEQQSGNIKNVGLGLYMQMLAEEIEILKNSKEYDL